MTDRLKGVYVAFDKDIRDDDAQSIIDAIKMIRHVERVEGNISNMDDWSARVRVKREVIDKLFDVINNI